MNTRGCSRIETCRQMTSSCIVNLESLLWNPIQECFPLKGENIEVKQVKSCRANRRYNADPMHEGGFLRATAVEVAEVLCEV